MPTTLEATTYLQEHDVLFGPAKAANAGGVGCSYFEMVQNEEGTKWEFEKTDSKLKEMMVNIYHNVANTAKEYGAGGNLVVGANIFGFVTVINKMD